ncbi:MAG: chorismate synthase [Ignavibacteriales bacterium]|nr:MAG: chorismate synthase [Ignavibacteriaceae bacterium]MBW7872939.1 chorismate synthase [Ignavibacteria bacterium]MCZ2142432.1 chorismate synthase [Ignavibacteriales bacterium]OQY76359.1 MAG: chorismate synthase [Ignavibacteriales bacterium UTCHB3]MBV6445314.1 Chorismate synthase [Ignavibacteriaceae bacterium]
MSQIRYLTAGESHGKTLVLIIEGFPANLEIDTEEINRELKRRQSGYGRGGRMKIEKDTAEIVAGVRFGKTTGAPISVLVRNKDWENWGAKMSVFPVDEKITKIEKITIPRPGHADLVGVTKYDLDDIRNSIERSSARETAVRVVAGSFAKQLLRNYGVKISSFVENIGGISGSGDLYDRLMLKEAGDFDSQIKTAEKSELRVTLPEMEKEIKDRIKQAKKEGDTLGGLFAVVAEGLVPGVGSFVHYDRKLDSEIAQAMVSINAVKAVGIGAGFDVAATPGSELHDEIILENEKIVRKTNRAGGIEGGTTNGENILVRVAMKPIATLMMPLRSVDLSNFQELQARRERSDFTAVPACSVIGEAVLAWSLAKFYLDKFGGDSVSESVTNFTHYKENIHKRLRENFGQ